MLDLYYDNIVYSLQRFGGISVYWAELTREFLKNKELNLHFFETGLELDNIERKILTLETDHIYQVKRLNLFYERFQRLSFESKNKKSVFHSSYFRLPEKNVPVKKICTVHDCTHEKFFKGPRLWLHTYLKKKAIHESDVVLTVSQNTKRDLLNYYPNIEENKILVIYNGVSNCYMPIKNIRHLNSDVPYILFVGSRYSYKNFDYAVALLSSLPHFNLYIVGSHFNKKELELLDKKLAKRYKLFTNIDTEQLNELYNEAFCLLYPSSYEGFGIPIVEAMKAGCPFVAFNASSIPEVAGDAGVLINSLELEEGISAIRTIERYRESIIEKGIHQAKNFSWQICASETLQIYKQLTEEV